MTRKPLHIALFAFLHGTMLMSILFMLSSSSYENDLFRRIVKDNTTKEMSDREKAIELLHVSHQLVKPRERLISKPRNFILKKKFINSADMHLQEAWGHCGSHSMVLARLLLSAGYQARIGQMQCGGEWNCHVFVEVKLDHNWVVLDGLANTYFTHKTGQMATFNEVSSNWDYFKSQVSESYASRYKFDGVRYTNWEKIPVVMPTIKLALSMVGVDVENFSLRVYFLNMYRIYAIALSILYAFLTIITGLWLWKTKK